jgi:hypothetical protein
MYAVALAALWGLWRARRGSGWPLAVSGAGVPAGCFGFSRPV